MSAWNWFGLGKRRPAVEPLEQLAGSGPAAASVGRRASTPLPHFSDSASDVGRTSGSNPVRARLRTAFTPSQPVADVRMFAGRHDILRTLIRSIEDQQLHVVLYGDRGIGKTSMLHVLAHLAREARYIVRYTSCGEGSDFGEMFRAVAADIPLLFHVDVGPASESAESGGVLADLLPPGPLTVSQVSEMFSKVAGTRVLVILDEFDRSDSAQFRRSIAELIKNLSDRSTRVQLIVAGVAANLSELIQHIPSIRRNIIGLPLPNMPDGDVRELIQIGSAQSGLSFDADAMSLITMTANGSPYLASLLGQHAGIAAVDRGGASVAPIDVVAAVTRALGEVELRVHPRSRHDIDRATEAGQGELLFDIAGEAMSSIGQIAPARDGAPPARAQQLAELDQGFGLLEANPDMPGGGYRFREDGVALHLWLRGVRDKVNGAKVSGTKVMSTP